MPTTIKTPTNKAEADAMTKAIAEYNLTRAQAVQDLLNGPEVAAFESLLGQVIEDGLPTGTTTAGNLIQLPKWFTDVRAQAANDLAGLTTVLAPEPAPVPEGEPEA